MSAVFSHSRIWQLTSHVYQDHSGCPASSIPSFCLTIWWVSFLLLDRVFALMVNSLTTCFCLVCCASLQSPPAYYGRFSEFDLMYFTCYAATNISGRFMSPRSVFSSNSNPFLLMPNKIRISLQHKAINDCFFFKGLFLRVV